MSSSLFAALVAGYLLGSIPFAHIIASTAGGVRLAAVGSGNVGTRNLTRELGLRWGLLGGVLDFSKGYAHHAQYIAHGCNWLRCNACQPTTYWQASQ